MKIIKLINNKNGWLVRFIDNPEIENLFGTDTLATAFTEKASPIVVRNEIQKLNPEYKVIFA